MQSISKDCQLSTIYTNHSLRATTVHLLDVARFPDRHIMSVTGHKAESSLKTYTVTQIAKQSRKCIILYTVFWGLQIRMCEKLTLVKQKNLVNSTEVCLLWLVTIIWFTGRSVDIRYENGYKLWWHCKNVKYSRMSICESNAGSQYSQNAVNYVQLPFIFSFWRVTND